MLFHLFQMASEENFWIVFLEANVMLKEYNLLNGALRESKVMKEAGWMAHCGPVMRLGPWNSTPVFRSSDYQRGKKTWNRSSPGCREPCEARRGRIRSTLCCGFSCVFVNDKPVELDLPAGHDALSTASPERSPRSTLRSDPLVWARGSETLSPRPLPITEPSGSSRPVRPRGLGGRAGEHIARRPHPAPHPWVSREPPTAPHSGASQGPLWRKGLEARG